jgi:putative transposase
MRPDPTMNNAFIYCLGEAALKFNVKPILSQMMSNHHHSPLLDPDGNAVEFSHRFHTHLAKCTNARRGRWENMWASEAPSRVELTEPCDLMDALVYTATNPVLAGLVERVHHWPGPNFVQAFLENRPLRARRPWFLFSPNGSMPEFIEFTLTIPPELGDPDEVRKELRRRIAEVEEACANKRARSGRRVLGRRQVRHQSWRARPNTVEPRRVLRPRVAARNKWARLAALQRNREFLSAYWKARALWLAGKPAVFPIGTYWLRKFANVTVATPPETTN